MPTHTDDSRTRCVFQLVQDQAERRPNVVAVAEATRALTYRQLAERADRLADKLWSVGVRPDVPVGLCMASSAAMVVGALGILKAGGAYLPLDPAHPAERLASILRDSGAPVLVTDDQGAPWAPEGVREVIGLDDSGWIQTAFARFRPDVDVGPGNLAYIIYTSGSTGAPKGVEITHGSLLNLVLWHQRAFALTHDDRASQVAGVGFDAAVWELWPYLTAGIPVEIAGESVRVDPTAMRDWLLKRGVTIGFAPTVMAERMLDLEWPADAPLRLLLTGGDALRRRPPRGLPFQLVNNYGPTECTVVTTSGIVAPEGGTDDPPSIGRPIANVRVYVMDEELREVADGEAGEMCVAGASVARGYRNRPDLTERAFVRDPFDADPDARMYRTGDLVRRLASDRIAFLGRIDDQVKIRGYRIEPDEVAHVLVRHPCVREGAVAAREDASGEKRLVAYWAPAREGSRPTGDELREFLKQSLPDYMVPGAFVELDELPVTSNGKVDRSALPAPEEREPAATGEFAEPSTPIERDVAGILAPLLGLDRVSADANFFLLGGHSLLGTQLIARLRDHFDVELGLKALFEAPTVVGISAEVERLILEKLDALDAAGQTPSDGNAVMVSGGGRA